MATHRFVICIENSGYEVSLERRKLYETIPDPSHDAHNQTHNQIRVIDESGEDYIYPRCYFLSVDLPEHIADQLTQAA